MSSGVILKYSKTCFEQHLFWVVTAMYAIFYFQFLDFMFILWPICLMWYPATL